MRNRRLVPAYLALLLILLLTPACSHGGTGAHQTAGMASLKVNLTDAPIDMANVQSVMVTLTGVIVYPDDADETVEVPDPGEDMEHTGSTGPTPLLTHPATFDLLTLTGGATALLASGEVPAGKYSRIRLEISDAQIVYLDGTSAPLKIDSNKVDIPIHFNLTVNEDLTVTLDFDAAASVQVNGTGSGSLILRPVVTPVESN